MEGAGTTTEPKNYRFTDERVEPNIHYRYRLRQIDLDGSASFSDIVEVFTEDPSQIALSEFYPNPVANGRASLNVNVADAGEANVSVFDIRGTLLRSNAEMLNAGRNRLSFSTDKLAAGPHFARVQIGDRVQYRKFVVAR